MYYSTLELTYFASICLSQPEQWLLQLENGKNAMVSRYWLILLALTKVSEKSEEDKALEEFLFGKVASKAETVHDDVDISV